MGKKDILQRSVDTGRDVGQRTQDRLETLLNDALRRSEQQAEQARTLLIELVERSRTTSEQVVETVDRELRAQLANLRLATQADISRLEARIDALGAEADATATKKAASKRAATKKAASKKAAIKKAATGRPAGRSATAR